MSQTDFCPVFVVCARWNGEWCSIFCSAVLSVIMLEMFFSLNCPLVMLPCFGWMIIKNVSCASGRQPSPAHILSVMLGREGRMICFRSSCKRLCDFVTKWNEMNCLTPAAVLLVSWKPMRAGHSVCRRLTNQINQSDKCSEGSSTEKKQKSHTQH